HPPATLHPFPTRRSSDLCITALRQLPARPPVFVPLPTSVDPRLAEALRARGISQLYSHQAKAWALIEKGQHVVIVTPTASGKTRSEEHTSELQSPDHLVC